MNDAPRWIVYLVLGAAIFINTVFFVLSQLPPDYTIRHKGREYRGKR